MKKRGFTLVELLAVIAILAVLLVIAVPSIMKMGDKMKTRGVESTLDAIEEAAVIYAEENSNAIKNEIITNHLNGNLCNESTVDDSYCIKDERDYGDGTKTAYYKYRKIMSVNELIDVGAYSPENENDKVTDARDSNKLLNYCSVIIEINVDYASAVATFENRNQIIDGTYDCSPK